MAGRGRIQPELADQWLAGFDPRTLRAETRTLAAELGYEIDDSVVTPMATLGQAIAELMDTTGRLERDIDLPAEIDGVEGRRFLLRMLSASLDTFVEYTDADRPTFHHAEGPHRKMFADCPDTDYLRAPIDVGDGRVYRLWGRIPAGTTYVGVLLYGRGGRVAGHLDDRHLQVDAEGRFELRIAVDPQPGVWLQAVGDENAVMVRQYYTDRAAEPPIEVHVELLGEIPPAEPLDPQWLSRRVDLSPADARRRDAAHPAGPPGWRPARR